jgi:hypothetical protein
MSGEDPGLGTALAHFIALYRDARTKPFSHQHPAFAALQECADRIRALLPSELADADVRPSVGQGNWANVPWIAVLHPDETTTTQRGIYPVLLFDEAGEKLEIALIQGVTELNRELGRTDAAHVMGARAERLAEALRGSSLRRAGFGLDDDFTLGDSTPAEDYVLSTIAHSGYLTEELPTSNIERPLRTLFRVYSELLQSGDLQEINTPPVTARAAIVYTAHAPLNLERAGLVTLRITGRLRAGQLAGVDLVLVAAGLHEVDGERSLKEVAVARLQHAATSGLTVEVMAFEPDIPLRTSGLGTKARAALQLTAAQPGSVEVVPVLGSSLLEAHYNTNSPTPSMPSPGPSPAPAARPPSPPTVEETNAATQAFVQAVESSGLLFGDGEVGAYIAALLTKPFTILTGLSGSGKTQLALRTGEWFGRDGADRERCLVLPVRPDWTGPEYLFGYQDALRSTEDKNVWAVPDALEFMQQARAEPDAPYLLVLDEMNLAHVERYFADFLSGIESKKKVLPEIERHGEEWRAIGNTQRLPVPPNLFVVGTVNVDETTYLFSPKVLDRAFTFEFRTATSDLKADADKPSEIEPADPAHLTAVVGLSRDPSWHRTNPHPLADDLADQLVRLHRTLTETNYEFGHRVLFEAMRYAAVLGTDPSKTDRINDVLDLIVLTKLLPKIHGTRARVDQTLVDLREFAGSARRPRLPRSAAKIDRMLKVVREAQFVSFTE